MRAQISLEFLMVTLVILILIGISLSVLANLKAQTDRSFELLNFKADALNLYSAAEDICALGNGNSRLISIKINITINKDSGLILFEHSGNRIVKKLECTLAHEVNELAEGKVLVRNGDGAIEFEQFGE